MLPPTLAQYQGRRIILASKSPRRRELLTLLGLPFEIGTLGDIDESYPESMSPVFVPEFLASKKAEAYMADSSYSDGVIIAADTVVIDPQGHLLGKPCDEAEAREMLLRLSGADHRVVSGVAVADNGLLRAASAMTEVRFASLSDEEIDWYIDNYRPLDKAGAYGIQEWIGAAAVSYISGSYYNVMGLPLHVLYRLLTATV